MQYTKQIIENFYNTLNTTTDPKQREQADQLLTAFQDSNEAWKVSEELLSSNNEFSQFFGSQVLHHKMKNSIRDITKDEELINLRNNLLLFIENGVIHGNIFKAAYHKLCMCLSLIGVASVHTCWETIIPDIIQYANKNIRLADISIKIIGNIPTALDEIRLPLKERKMIKSKFRESLNTTLDFCCAVLMNEEITIQQKTNMLDGLKGWGSIGGGKLLEHSTLKNIIINLLSNDAMMEVATDLIIEALSYSEYIKILENAQFSECFNQLKKNNILGFIHDLISHFKNYGLGKLSSLQQNPSKFPIIKKYTELGACIGENFSIILFENSDVTQAFFEMMMQCCKLGNRSSVVESFQFWASLKENILLYAQPNNCNVDHILVKFAEFVEILREKCEFLDSDFDLNTEEDFVDSDDLKNIQIKEFRLYSIDIFFLSFYLLQTYYAEKGEEVVYEIIRKNISQEFDQFSSSSPEYKKFCKVAESCIFLGHSLLDALPFDEESIPFLQNMYQTIFKLPKENFIMVAALDFFSESSAQLKYTNNLISEALSYVVNSSMSQQSIGSKCILEIFENCTDYVTLNDMENILQFFTQNMTHLDFCNIGRIAEALGTKCAKMEQIKNAIEICLQLPRSNLIQFNSQEINPQVLESTKPMLMKYLSMLIFFIKPFEKYGVEASQLEDSLLPIIVELNPILCKLLDLYVSDSIIVGYICNVYLKSLGALSAKLINIFPEMAKALIQCFEKNKENCLCLKIITFSFSCFYTDPTFAQIINENWNQLCKVIIMSINPENIDTQLILYFAEFLSRTFEAFEELIINTSFLNDIILLLSDYVVSIHEFDSNRQIIRFFNLFLNSQAKNQQVVQNFISRIAFSLTKSIPNLNNGLMLNTGNLFTALLQFNEEIAKEAIVNGLKDDIYQSLENQYKEIIVNFIILFKNDQKAMKGVISDLNKVINRMATKDLFISYELRISERFKKIKEKAATNVIDIS